MRIGFGRLFRVSLNAKIVKLKVTSKLKQMEVTWNMNTNEFPIVLSHISAGLPQTTNSCLIR